MWKRLKLDLNRVAKLFKASALAFVSIIDTTTLFYSRVIVTVTIALSILTYAGVCIYHELKYKPIYNSIRRDTQFNIAFDQQARVAQSTPQPTPASCEQVMKQIVHTN